MSIFSTALREFCGALPSIDSMFRLSGYYRRKSRCEVLNCCDDRTKVLILVDAAALETISAFQKMYGSLEIMRQTALGKGIELLHCEWRVIMLDGAYLHGDGGDYVSSGCKARTAAISRDTLKVLSVLRELSTVM